MRLKVIPMSQMTILKLIVPTVLAEICNNSLDDDSDGLIDCPDPDRKPSPTITSNSPVCAGTTLNINSTITGMPVYNYTWS